MNPADNHVRDTSATTHPVEYTGWYPTQGGNYRWYYWSGGRLKEGVTVRDPNLYDRLLEEAEDALQKARRRT